MIDRLKLIREYRKSGGTDSYASVLKQARKLEYGGEVNLKNIYNKQ